MDLQYLRLRFFGNPKRERGKTALLRFLAHASGYEFAEKNI